jgi:hypothetical protein
VNPELFVYVKLPDPVGPIDRGKRYEDPIAERLAEESLGEVSGGGSQLGDEQPDGTRPIEFCGIDVEVTDRRKALDALRVALIELHAPIGTELHYTVAGVRLQDEFQADGWVLEKPRFFVHPAFGC